MTIKDEKIDDTGLRLTLLNIENRVRQYRITDRNLILDLKGLKNHSKSIYQTHFHDNNSIQNNPHLSSVGRREKLAELQKQTMKEIEDIQSSLPYDNTLSNILNKMVIKKDSDKSELHREIRAEAKLLSPLERSRLYRNASKTGCDDDLLAAFEGQLKSFPLIGEEDLKEGKKLQEERLFPEQCNYLNQVKGAKMIAHGIISALKKSL